MIQRLLRLARALGLFALSRWLTRGQLRILCYHGVWMGPEPHFGDRLFMDPQTFSERMDWLAAHYRVISLADGLRGLDEGRIGARDVVITVDDGWKGTARHMLPALARHGFSATLYIATRDVLDGGPVADVVAIYLAERCRRQPDGRPPWGDTVPPGRDLAERIASYLHGLPAGTVRDDAVRALGTWLDVEIGAVYATESLHLMDAADLRASRAQGVDVQLHTHSHSLHDMKPERVQEEVERNRAELARLLGTGPQDLLHFCYPSGEYDVRVFELLRACGVQSATTTEFGLAGPRGERLTLPRILDGQSMTLLDLEARLSGFWVLLSRICGRAR